MRMVAQSFECTKNHCRVYFETVNVMVSELHFKQKDPSVCHLENGLEGAMCGGREPP